MPLKSSPGLYVVIAAAFVGMAALRYFTGAMTRLSFSALIGQVALAAVIFVSGVEAEKTLASFNARLRHYRWLPVLAPVC